VSLGRFSGVEKLALILDLVVSAQVDGAMSKPDISQFLSHLPSYPLTTALKTVASTIQQSVAMPPSHIVVVDAQQCPIGTLAVGRLWAYTQQAKITADQAVAPATVPISDSDTTRELSQAQNLLTEPQLNDCQPWLEPIALIPAQATLAELWPIIQAHPQKCWVVINEHRQYEGIIEATALLTWLTTQLPNQAMPGSTTEPYQTARLHLSPPSTHEHSWAMAVGHALKTPLTSLLGLSTLLLDQRIGPLNERQTRYVWLMQQSIRKLTRIINQLVDWMRLEANQIVIDLASIDLQPFLDTLLPTFLASWLAEPEPPPAWVQSFTITLNPDLTTLVADQLRLLQSLHGVLDYLLHHGATPGGITLDRWGTWLGITLWAANPASETPLAHPWSEPYPHSAADPLEGLGLALARRFCQGHGGDLVGFWSPSCGYQMTLLLPIATEPALAPDASLSTRLVLLLSTKPTLVDEIYGQLQPQGYRLVVASHWHEAVTLTQRLAPSVVLLHDEAVTAASVLTLAELAPAQAASPPLVWIGTVPNPEIAAQTIGLPIDTLAQQLLPTLTQLRSKPVGGLPTESVTLLLLRYRHLSGSAPLTTGLSSQWQAELQHRRCRLLQADDPSQANLLCRVWQPQAIVLDRYEPVTQVEADHLSQFQCLTQMPIITLVSPTPGLSTGLRLVDGSTLLTYPPDKGVVALIQVIHAAQGLS